MNPLKMEPGSLVLNMKDKYLIEESDHHLMNQILI